MKKEIRIENYAGQGSYHKYSQGKVFAFFLVALLLLSFVVFVFTRSFTKSALTFVIVLVIVIAYSIIGKRMQVYQNVKKMEEVFPDFISLVASNLRAGMTVDRAMLLSSRKEFSPLDREITKLGKDIMTGKEISLALKKMSERINSDLIRKTVSLIITGIRAGGNMSVLLEETASNMRERSFVRKRATSNVLMYVIFIFFAVAVGAPTLFALSSVLVKVLSSILGDIPTENLSVSLPFTLSKITVSNEFIFYYSLVFVIISSFLSSLIIGLVSKGKERDGLKYSVILAIISVSVFLGVRLILLSYFSDFFS